MAKKDTNLETAMSGDIEVFKMSGCMADIATRRTSALPFARRG
jgi:hypothetical protein